MNTTTIRISVPTPTERGAINILTTEERKAALLAAARQKAMVLALPPKDEAGVE